MNIIEGDFKNIKSKTTVGSTKGKLKKKKPSINLGDREFDLFSCKVCFSPTSRIEFYNKKTEEVILSLDPTELSTIYGAYMQMREELGD